MKRWQVKLYLGVQCSWCLTGDIYATNQTEAIDRARRAVAEAWPHLAVHVLDTPATATLRRMLL